MPWKMWRGELVTSEEYAARKYADVAASDLPFPAIHTDQIELKSMVDGKIYTSKRALRASYRANGYVEVGNEELKPKPKAKPDRKAIRDSVERAMVRAGVLPY